ncbi:class F sortase [Brevibacterium sp. UCMA 11754]|uniref:class F sortase n=1 Tax=Brevibacterium sp. UCMA 11754 TaxID=2749198 RepID=UPI001F30B635|nr:class F sortase [Brevibacterium sp. UCMA 11754]MCF2574039.1 class F sortase [Brevibacterium sp. UCMA 11754]
MSARIFRDWWSVPVAVVIIALICAGAWMLTQGLTDEQNTAESNANVRLEEPPSKSEVQDMQIEALDGDFQVPSVGLDTGLETMSEVNGTINPPGLRNGYVVRNHGTPDHPERGTTFVAIHSVQGSNAPGNKLIDVDAGEPTVEKGESITLQDHSYTVTDSYTVSKNDISGDDRVWADEPGRLVILTCLQRSSGRSADNVVIEAIAD